MRTHLPSVAALALLAAACGSGVEAGVGTLRINGSTTVNPVVAEAAEALRDRAGMAIVVDTQGGSSGGIAMLAEGQVEVAMSSRPVDDRDRAKFPGVDFVEHTLGYDAVALVVSTDVWDGGVRSLSREEVRAIYEGRTTNWRDVGGADQRIVFFNKEPGRGTWEVFADWLYGDASDAPTVRFLEVGGNEETRNKVASTRGAMSQLSSSWADGERVHALAIEVDGAATEPTSEAIAGGEYPLRRPLLLVTDGPPDDRATALLEHLLGDAGQATVRHHGYLSIDQLEE